MNKRGAETFMAEKTANIILAVISIVVLLLLGYTLFGMIFQQQEYQQAKATIVGIQETIGYLNVDQSKSYLIESPKNWVFIKIKDKICMCKPVFTDSRLFDYGSCVSTGVCFSESLDITFNNDCIMSTIGDAVGTAKINLRNVVAGTTVPSRELVNGCYQIQRVPSLVNLTLKSDKTIYMTLS